VVGMTELLQSIGIPIQVQNEVKTYKENDMEKIIKQVDSLVESLVARIKVSDDHQAKLNEQQDKLDFAKYELDEVKANLLQREKTLKPIEDIEKVRKEIFALKAEAQLEVSKLRGDREAFEKEKKNHGIENASNKKILEDKISLYNRGAEENKKAKEKLKDKLKTLQDVRAGV